MGARRPTVTLGLLLGALVPALIDAQSPIARPVPAPRIAVTLAPPPAEGARGNDHGGYPLGPMDHTGPAPRSDHRFGRAWPVPLIITSTYESRPAAPTAHPVPYYYPVPVSAPPVARRESGKPVLPPYDPTKSRTLIVGAGADGGGGAMRIARPTAGTVGLTWLGTTRPIRQARLFLADSEREPLASRVVTLARRDARFRLGALARQVAYAGLTVDFADGSKQTTLVPLLDTRR